jgi:ferredoxin-NADP reductase
MSEENFRKIKLLKKTPLTDQVVEFEFEKPSDFHFQSGQFIQVHFESEGKKIARSYSISSTPQSPVLQLCVKLVPNGSGSNYLESLNVGDEIIVGDPKGHFSSSQISGNKYFVATSVGVAPMISMLENEKNSNGSLFLLFGVRYEKDLFWIDRFENLKKANSKFNFEATVSRPEEGWQGKKGRVTEHLPIDQGANYFICGSLLVVKDVRKKLLENGVSTKCIHLEIF